MDFFWYLIFAHFFNEYYDSLCGNLCQTKRNNNRGLSLETRPIFSHLNTDARPSCFFFSYFTDVYTDRIPLMNDNEQQGLETTCLEL